MFPGPESSTTVPAFVAKLWQMVCDPKYDDLISWCDSGSTFVIKDQARFCSEMLPMYYKHNNMASFIRQLNKYGFRKVVSVNSASLKGDMSDFEFCHPHFIKGCPLLLEQIKRKVSISRDITDYRNDQGLLTKLLLEVQQMKQKQTAFESRITAMKAENDALWREHSILRQKHQKQQKIVNKLIHFLLSLVHQTRGVNVKRRNMPLMLKDGTCLSIEGLEPIKGRHYSSTSPVICEIDPGDVFMGTKLQNDVLGNNESNIDIIIPDQSNVMKSQLKNSGDIFIDVASPSTVSMPSQEVTPGLEPAKIKTEEVPKKSSSTKGVVNRLPDKRTGLSNDKRLVKVRKILPNTQNLELVKLTASSNDKVSKFLNTNSKIANKKIGAPIVNKKTTPKDNIKGRKKSLKNKRCNKLTSLQTIELLDDKLLGESQDTVKLQPETDISNVNIFSNDVNFTLDEESNFLSSGPIILSPSGTPILSPQSAEEPVKEDNSSTSLVLSDINSPYGKQEVENHIDLIQSDIDALKEILHSEGLSLDASTIMGLFGGDDPLSLNMPEAGKTTDNLNPSPVGNELVSYSSPSLIDFADGFDDDEPTTNGSSLLDELSSSLNTPQQVTFTTDFPPSPSKLIKK